MSKIDNLKQYRESKDENTMVRTPKRRLWMLNNYTSCGLHITEIIKVLNEMPGVKITKDSQVHNWAVRLGVKRMRVENKSFAVIKNDVWNEARCEWLREHWLDRTPLSEMLAQINQIPGDRPIKNTQAMQYQAGRMKLPSRAKIGRQVQAARAREFSGSKKSGAPVRVWTPERCILLRELWSQTLTAKQIKAIIEERCPGPEISNVDAVKRRAHAMNLPPRSADVRRQLISMVVKETNRARVYGKIEPVKADLHYECSPERADSVIANRMDKARAMLRAKKDPFDIHVAVKLPLREVYRLQAEIKGRL